MAKKRLERRQKGYEAYKKNAGRIALVASVLGLGFVLASVVNEAFGLRAAFWESASSKTKDITPYLRETMIPHFTHALFLLFLYLAILLGALFFLYGRLGFKQYACSSLIVASLFGFVKPVLAIYDDSKTLKETIIKINDALAKGENPPFPSVKEYLLKEFIPRYMGDIALIMILLGVIVVAVYFLTDSETMKRIGFSEILVGGFSGAVGKGMTLYFIVPRIKSFVDMVDSYIAAGQGQQIGYGSVEEFVGQEVVPLLLDNISSILLFLGACLLALYLIWKIHWGKSAGGIAFILGGFLAAFGVFLQTAFLSIKLRGEIGTVRQALQGGQSYKVFLGEWGLDVSSMLGYFTRKFIPYYLDQFSTALFYAAIMILALYVIKKTSLLDNV